MLDSRRLRVLCEVARHGSFSAAAEALGYTQPAVSRQIATLEAEVGAVLVRRVPQGAVLTDAGRLLSERGAAVLSYLQDMEDELRALLGPGGGDAAAGHVRLGGRVDRAAGGRPVPRQSSRGGAHGGDV